ncbi:MAG: LysR substrate-binding domain-containing protein, partial [Desulfobacterales bacterium]|nr:LysR substrate-binding domain-containing protein [Desulfobacterales bacterium]
MELRHIKYFVTVAEELHFGRAASRLNISQPPLSQQIQNLEYELGTKLFFRTKREVSLTKSGELLLREAYQLLEQAKRIKRIAKRSEAGEIGEIRIGIITSACFEVLPTILDRLRKTHPKVGFNVKEYDTADALPAIADGVLDVGLVRVNKVNPPLKNRPLKDDYMVLALPEGHHLISKDKVGVADIKNETFIMFARDVSPLFYDSIMGVLRNQGLIPELVHTTNSIQTQIAFVGSGLGVALVPSTTKRQNIPGIVY